MSARGHRAALAAALALALGACATPAPTELINVTYTPSVPTEHYATWQFDLAACEDTGDPRIDDDVLRRWVLAAVEAGLERRGYARGPRAGDDGVDFLVFHELEVAPPGALAGPDERGRLRLRLRDVATGRQVWRGERKATLTLPGGPDEVAAAEERLRAAVESLLDHVDVLRGPPPRDPDERPPAP